MREGACSTGLLRLVLALLALPNLLASSPFRRLSLEDVGLVAVATVEGERGRWWWQGGGAGGMDAELEAVPE